MVIRKNFGEENIVNSHLEKFGATIKEKKALPEYKDLSDKEIIKEHIGAEIKRLGTESPSAGAPKISNTPVGDAQLPDYLKNESEQIKIAVEKLVEGALRRGPEKAITAALANPFSPFLLDALHDTLTDKFYDELKKRKLI